MALSAVGIICNSQLFCRYVCVFHWSNRWCKYNNCMYCQCHGLLGTWILWLSTAKGACNWYGSVCDCCMYINGLLCMQVYVNWFQVIAWFTSSSICNLFWWRHFSMSCAEMKRRNDLKSSCVFHFWNILSCGWQLQSRLKTIVTPANQLSWFQCLVSWSLRSWPK